MKSVSQTPKRAVLYARVSTEAQAADDKTSLSEQLLALRKHADAHSWRVVEEITESVSGRKQETEALERIRDLAESEAIDILAVYKWNRLARTVRRFETLMLEMKLEGVELISLDGQSNETATGRLFNRMVAAFSEYSRDEIVETMQQGKRGAARSGKIVPGRFPPFGFDYDRQARAYTVDEDRMAHVRRMFRAVGSEGGTLWGAKRELERAGAKTTTGKAFWDVRTIKDMIQNDVYLARTPEELRALVEGGNLAPDVWAGLEAKERYGIRWYNKHRIENTPEGRQKRIDRPREEWIAVPVPDAGIPPEWVLAAREAVAENVRPPDAGRRAWALAGRAWCPCGARLKPHTVTKRQHAIYYYVCRAHRRGRAPCPHAKYHRAEALEGRVADFALNLVRNPDTLRAQIEAEAGREREALRDTRKHLAALARRVSEADAERDRYNRLYAKGKLTDDEHDAYTAEVEARKAEAEAEVERLKDARHALEDLERLPKLIDEYLRELPEIMEHMPRIRERVPVEAPDHGSLRVREVSPGYSRKRTQEELEALRDAAERERAERYAWLYAKLGLDVVVFPDGTLEVSWRGGVSKLAGIPSVRPKTTSKRWSRSFARFTAYSRAWFCSARWEDCIQYWT
jgi:DNA invertase Pin-like site-specific DNA recombinase